MGASGGRSGAGFVGMRCGNGQSQKPAVLTHRVDATTRHPHLGNWLAPCGSLLVTTENKAVAGGRELMGSRRALYGVLRVNVLIHRGLREKAELEPLTPMHAASGVCPAHIRCLSGVAGCVQQYASQRQEPSHSEAGRGYGRGSRPVKPRSAKNAERLAAALRSGALTGRAHARKSPPAMFGMSLFAPAGQTFQGGNASPAKN